MLASNLSGTKGERGTKGPSKTKATPPERAPLPPTRMSPKLPPTSRWRAAATSDVALSRCRAAATAADDDFCVAPVGTLMAAYGYNMGGWGRLLAAGERTAKKKAVAGGR